MAIACSDGRLLSGLEITIPHRFFDRRTDTTAHMDILSRPNDKKRAVDTFVERARNGPITRGSGDE
jgi:hypothetical protein